MSLIVARKVKGEIIIVSDTKLSIQNEEKVSGERQKSTPTSGVIKVTMISPLTCIAFAGEEDTAEEAIKSINPTNTVDNILGTLLQFHLNSESRTDFIVACATPIYKLFEIKNRKCTEREATWIGSPRGFSLFQKFMLGENKTTEIENPQKYSEDEREQWLVYLNMVKSMDETIGDEKVPEIGGFRVCVATKDGNFQYNSYNHKNFCKITIPPVTDNSPSTISITDGGAEIGAYSINFFLSKNINYAALHVLQGNFGIIYERKNGGLLRPNIMPEIDEVDFIDYTEKNYGVHPEQVSQNRDRKYQDEANKSFKKLDFEGILYWANKGLESSSGWHRGFFCYIKAFALVNLKQYQDVPQLLQEAVRLDTTHTERATELMNIIRSEIK